MKVGEIMNGGKLNGVVWNINDSCCPDSYVRLSDVPEIAAGVQVIAELLGNLPIHLNQNSDNGDITVRNELSRKVDIEPCKYLTRPLWIQKIVTDMLLTGNSVHVPIYSTTTGYLEEIKPLSAYSYVIESDVDDGYCVRTGREILTPDEVLHFVYNPDPYQPWRGNGLKVSLKKVAKSLERERKTSDKLMASPMPSLAVRVDAFSEDFKSPEGRKEMTDRYWDSTEQGKPWFIPSDTFSLEQIKPLSINDLAIPASVEIDKRTAAAILGIPPYLLGVGEFDAEGYNNFVERKLFTLATLIEQELTRKLLIRRDWFFKFKNRKLYAYSRNGLAEIACNLVDRGIISRNEARDEFGYNPLDGLDELAILENYIPFAKMGDQKKLTQKGGEEV